MEGINSTPRPISEEELLITQTEGDREGRRERIENINKKIDESTVALQSKFDKGEILNLSADDLWGYTSVYDNAVMCNDLDSKYNDDPEGMALLKEKMSSFWELLDKALVMVAENAIAKADKDTLGKIARIYFLKGNPDQPFKYQEYLGDLKERIAKDATSQNRIG